MGKLSHLSCVLHNWVSGSSNNHCNTNTLFVQCIKNEEKKKTEALDKEDDKTVCLERDKIIISNVFIVKQNKAKVNFPCFLD